MKYGFELLYQLVLGFFATIGFAVYFYAPMDSVLASGVAGGLSWVLYYIVLHSFNNKILGTFLGALLVGILGEFLAVKMKKPATVFITPGIVSLVPGAGMYYTMLYLVQNDYNRAVIVGTETLFVAAAIAIGIIVSTIFSKSLRFIKKKHS
ncbi:MAG: threonine/serine exporter family protein [Tissierellaceae bacterium]|nr:threonine/serine exporter family protein [Tissierellaceae bacterium]